MTTLANLKNSLQGRIYNIGALFDKVTTFRAAAQEFDQIGYIQKITDLTLEAMTKFQDIEARHKGDIETIELNTLRTSLTNIKHRKANIFAALRAQNVKKITGIDTKARARELQVTSRAQQCTTGKPSTQSNNLDTALPTIRPALVLPEEHHDTIDKEGHKQRKPSQPRLPVC